MQIEQNYRHLEMLLVERNSRTIFSLIVSSASILDVVAENNAPGVCSWLREEEMGRTATCDFCRINNDLL